MEEMYNYDRFNEIIYINCSYYKINELKILPNLLQELLCFNNKIKELKDLPKSLQELHCSNNKIKELKDIPNSLRKLYCFNNEIKELKDLPKSLQILSCQDNKIKELKDLPKSLQYIFCDEEVVINNISETLEIKRVINLKIFNNFMNDKVNEEKIINKFKMKMEIGEETKCLICHEIKNCVHLPCHKEHTYCLKCFVNWYYINENEKKCCLCMKPFHVENCLFI